MKIAIKNGRIIDGTGAAARKGTVVIDGGKISAVLPPDATLPEVDDLIDASGKTVMPGLIDSHDHQTYHNTFGPLPKQWRISRDQMIIRSVIAGVDALRHGVTSIREMGGAGATPFSMKKAMEIGDIVGPRITTCGTPLAVTGGHAYEICYECSGTEAVRAAVRDLIKQGADFIKLMASNEQPMPGDQEQTVPEFSLEELKVAVETSHEAGRKVAVHVCGAKAIERCLDAGVDTVEHGVYMTRELAQRMKEKEVFYTPTIGIYIANSDPHWQRGSAKGAFCNVLTKAHKESFAHALEVGLRWTVGTDAIVPMADEMKHLVDLGLDPMTVLCAATKTNAELIEKGDQLGTIEAGKLADIIVIDGDPLEDITRVGNVETIIQGGRVFSPDQLLPMLPSTVPPPPEDNLR